MKATVIIQAKYGASRLNGKVLLPLPYSSETTVLEQVARRASKAEGVEQVIIATTQDSMDDIVESCANSLALPVFRGSKADVLDRYYQAALKFNADPIIRITADCPCIDSAVIGEMLALYYESKADYVSNTQERTYPHGLDAEVFSFSALEAAWREADNQSYREHVTPYIYRSGKFKLAGLIRPELVEGEQDIRVTLDTAADYAALCAIYKILGEDFDCAALCELFRREGWIGLINEHIIQKKVFDSASHELEEAVELLRMQGMDRAAAILQKLPNGKVAVPSEAELTAKVLTGRAKRSL